MTKNPESVISREQGILRGGEFLIKDTHPDNVFIPEDFDEEQLMVRDMVIDFLNNDLLPVMDRVEAQEAGLAERLLAKMGEL